MEDKVVDATAPGQEEVHYDAQRVGYQPWDQRVIKHGDDCALPRYATAIQLMALLA